MRGWLVKQGGSKGGKKNWKRRWFVLADTTITYYSSKTSTKPKGYMDVSDSEVTVSTVRPHCFSIRTVQRELLIQAVDDAEMTTWIQAIRASIVMPPKPEKEIEAIAAEAAFGVAAGDRDGGFLRMPGTSMFWDVKAAKPIFLPTMWTLKHVRCVRYPDYLDIANHKETVAMLRTHGDSKILFSDFVVKINRDKKMQRRVLLLTDSAVYTLHDETFQSRRRMVLDDIGGLSYSNLGDEFLVLHVPSHYDYLLSSSRKGEIIDQVIKGYEEKFHRTLPTRIYGGDQPSCEGWRWMEQVWDPNARYPAAIVAGSPSAMHKIAARTRFFKAADPGTPIVSPTLKLAEDNLISMMSSGAHPLGSVISDYIRRFTSKYTRAPADLLEDAVQSLKTFFDHVQHDLSRALANMACKCTSADSLSALYSVTFPKIHDVLIALFNSAFEVESSQILRKMQSLQRNNVSLMRFLSITEQLFLCPIPNESSEARVSVSFHQENEESSSVIVMSYQNMGALEEASEAENTSIDIINDIIDNIENYENYDDSDLIADSDQAESDESSISSPNKLSIPKCVADPYAAATEIMREIPTKKTPAQKAECIERSVRAIIGCVDSYYADKAEKPIIGADDMLPLIIFVLMHSNIPNLLSEAKFISEFMSSDCGGESVYCIRTFEIAVSFLQTLDAEMIKLATKM